MADVRDIIAATAREWGGGLNVDPVALALATAQQESGFNDQAVGDQGHSVGPFQENDQGAGAGMTFAQRADPIEATKRFLRRAFAVQQAGVTGAGWIAAEAQRPFDPEGYARSVDALYAKFSGSTGPTIQTVNTPSSQGTYIGGGSAPAVIGDPPTPSSVPQQWQSPSLWTCIEKDASGRCTRYRGPFGWELPSLPILGPVPGGDQIGKGITDATGAGGAISAIGDRALTGARQLVIAGVVVAAVAALVIGGTRRTVG